MTMVPIAAHAVDVRVTVTGAVDFNVIAGGMAGTPPGAPVSMALTVDSNAFLDSAGFPTRGYRIDPASFAMTVGGTAAHQC